MRAGAGGRRVPPLFLELAAAALARVFLNTARRFPYVFGPALARALGVPLTAITPLIALNQATGLLSPVLGALADRHGSRTLMLAGLVLLAGGMLGAGLFFVYPVVLAGLFLGGLGKSCYDPALQAHVAARVPYRRRGLAIGLVETAWAGSTLVGIPLVGVLAASFGWPVSFATLGALALVGLGVLAALLPADRPGSAPRPPGGLMGARAVLARPAARAALAYAFLFSMANDSLFVVYGAWLEQAFGLGVAALGTATTVIGLAELGGEGLTTAFADRIGLRRATRAGIVATALAYLLLPALESTLPVALGCLFVAFLAFEFTIVTGLSQFTEVAPEARGTMMASVGAASSAGRAVGALVGGPLWLAGGLPASAGAAAALTLLALAALAAGSKGRRDRAVLLP